MGPGIWPVQGRSKTRPKLTTPKKWRKKTFFEHVIFPPKSSPQKVPNPPAPTPVRSKLPKSQGRQKSPYVDFKFPCDMQCACMYMHMYLHMCLHMCLHTCLHTCMHTHLHTCPHTYPPSLLFFSGASRKRQVPLPHTHTHTHTLVPICQVWTESTVKGILVLPIGHCLSCS